MKHPSKYPILFALSFISLFCANALHSDSLTPATAKYTVSPRLLTASESESSGIVKIEAKINRFGQVTGARSITASNKELVDACLDAIVRWKFEPAKRNGEAVASTVVQPFQFSPGTITLSDKKSAFTQSPHAYKRVKPTIPEKYSNISGHLAFIVNLDADGEIEEIALQNSTHEELVEPTKAALLKWKFAPAIDQGEATPSKVLVPIRIWANSNSLDKTIRSAFALDKVDTKPTLIAKHEPVLPVALEKEKGETWLLLYIDEFGYIAQADTLKSSDPTVARLAKEAVLHWKYQPATKNGRPVASKIAVPFQAQGGLLVSRLSLDVNPKAIKKKSPKLPTNLAHTKGYVRVLVDLDEHGNVVTASVRESSHADLDEPTLEAVEKWKFRPAQRAGKSVSSTVVLPFVFGNS